MKAWHFVGDTLRDGRPVHVDGRRRAPEEHGMKPGIYQSMGEWLVRTFVTLVVYYATIVVILQMLRGME